VSTGLDTADAIFEILEKGHLLKLNKNIAATQKVIDDSAKASKALADAEGVLSNLDFIENTDDFIDQSSKVWELQRKADDAAFAASEGTAQLVDLKDALKNAQDAAEASDKAQSTFKKYYGKMKKFSESAAGRFLAAATLPSVIEILKAAGVLDNMPGTHISYDRDGLRRDIPHLDESGKFYGFQSSNPGIWEYDSFGASKTLPSDMPEVARDLIFSGARNSFEGGTTPGLMTRSSKDATPEEIFLTFSGGSHAVEYTFLTSESRQNGGYHFHADLRGTSENTQKFEFAGPLGILASLALSGLGIDSDEKHKFSKRMSHDRAFAWNSHGQVSTTYSLGDPDFGDKFVIRVSSDPTFGTPVFNVKGGRTLCPGEPGTVWRQAGIQFSSLQSSLDNQDLPPDDRATLIITIQNESPYRESSGIGFQIVDLVSESVTQVIDAAYDAAWNARTNAEDQSSGELFETFRTDVTNAAATCKASDHDVIGGMLEIVQNAENPDCSSSRESMIDSDCTFKHLLHIARDIHRESWKAPDVGFEMYDLEFLAMNERLSPLGDVVPLRLLGADGLRTQNTVRKTSFTLTIGRGGSALSELKHIGLRLVSLCEFDISSNLNRSPISDTVRLGKITWAQKCPPVTFSKRTIDMYSYKSISTREDEKLEIEVVGDLTSDLIHKTRIQYRRAGSVDEWKSARSRSSSGVLESVDLRKSKFAWDIAEDDVFLLDSDRDGKYEVRVKNFCGGSPTAGREVYQFVSDETFTLNIDKSTPMQQGIYHDKYSRSIWANYAEKLHCSEMQVTLTKLIDASCKAVSADDQVIPSTTLQSTYEIKCIESGGDTSQWIMRYPSTASGTFRVDVSNLKDAAGNVAEQFSWLFTTAQGKEDCSKYMCGANEHVSNNRCMACDEGYVRPAGDNVLEGKDTKCDMCAKNFYKAQHGGCIRCSPGTTSDGDDVNECTPTHCAGISQFVRNHTCEDCPSGAERNMNSTFLGDDASGSDTECDRCKANYFRDGESECKPCHAFYTSLAGSTESSACVPSTCDRDHRVHDHKCEPCPKGYANHAGDKIADGNTTCTMCATGYYPTNEAKCEPCAQGSTTMGTQLRFDEEGSPTQGKCDVPAENYRAEYVPKESPSRRPVFVEVEAYQKSAAGSNVVENITCHANQFINATNHTCQNCTEGYANSVERLTGDELYMRFSCTQCAENYRASQGKCVPCEAGYRNAAGDDVDPSAEKFDTNCTMCAADYRVKDGKCRRCPIGHGSPGGAIIENGDSTCDECAENYFKNVTDDRCEKCAVDKFSRGGRNATCEPVKCSSWQASDESTDTNSDSSATSFAVYRAYVHNHKCVSCETGYVSRHESASSCDYCDARRGFMPNGYGECKPFACPTGFALPDPHVSKEKNRIMPACTFCAENYFVTATGTCEPCPSGTRSTGTRNITQGETACVAVNQLIDSGPIVNTSSLGVERVRSRRRLAHSSVGSQSFASFVPLITVFVLGLVFRAYSRHASSASWAVRPSSERDATVHAATPLVSCETSAHLRGPYGASV